MQKRHKTGLVTADALRREDVPPDEIQRALEAGELRPVAPGLAATPEARRDVLDAITEGWRPTCLSAADAHGLWVPQSRDRRLHGYKTRTPRGAAPSAVVPHAWHDAWPEPDPLASIPLLLDHAVGCLDLESCVVLAESALHLGLLTPDEWEFIVEGAPRRARRVLRRAATTSESGSETRVRLGFEAQRIPVEAQAFIPGVGRVDLLYKDLWVIECDSRAHHESDIDSVKDRQRDLLLQALGYLVTRLSYPQIWYEWEQTWRMLMAQFQSLRYRERRPLVG